MKRILLSLLLTPLAGCAAPGASNPVGAGSAAPAAAYDTAIDFARHFGDLHGTFVLLHGATGARQVHDPVRARTGHLPASTFKIPNTLIALETGVAPAPDVVVAWDSVAEPRQAWWPAAWAGDQTLRSAFAGSVVWFYQRLARQVGAGRMQAYLDRFRYGNRRIGGGIDQFWLSGDLRITAEEQVDFLRRFHEGRLDVSPAATAVARTLFVLEEGPGWKLSGKSGWAGFGEAATPQLGWLVGYLERGGDVHYFAMNIDIREPSDAAARMRITRGILQDLGLLDG